MQVLDAAGCDHYRYVMPPVCAVPAGPFLMGSDQQCDPDAHDLELPQHSLVLDPYQIACYPLTVGEYGYFVQATNHVAPMDWNEQHQRPEHPVVAVTWQDAVAYTQWFAQVTDEGWRLPTEAEWEKAARGTDGRIYPWGNDWDTARANTRDSGLGTTTTVGSYAGGASPYGALDIAGNVAEWTSTTYQPYPYQADDGREDPNNRADKILRGGSWRLIPQSARAAFRGRAALGVFNFAVGVRLVLSGAG